MSDYEETLRQRARAERRQKRLEKAREKGMHSKKEWRILHDLFGRCVACGVEYKYLSGGAATKDHILPLIAGGCDCIANLQPLCRRCNSRKICADLREFALPGWQSLFLSALERLHG